MLDELVNGNLRKIPFFYAISFPVIIYPPVVLDSGYLFSNWMY